MNSLARVFTKAFTKSEKAATIVTCYRILVPFHEGLGLGIRNRAGDGAADEATAHARQWYTDQLLAALYNVSSCIERDATAVLDIMSERHVQPTPEQR